MKYYAIFSVLVLAFSASAAKPKTSAFPHRTLDLTNTSLKLKIHLVGGFQKSGILLKKITDKKVTLYQAATFQSSLLQNTHLLSPMQFAQYYQEFEKFYNSASDKMGKNALCSLRMEVVVEEADKMVFQGHLCTEPMDTQNRNRFKQWYAHFR